MHPGRRISLHDRERNADFILDVSTCDTLVKGAQFVSVTRDLGLGTPHPCLKILGGIIGSKGECLGDPEYDWAFFSALAALGFQFNTHL